MKKIFLNLNLNPHTYIVNQTFILETSESYRGESDRVPQKIVKRKYNKNWHKWNKEMKYLKEVKKYFLETPESERRWHTWLSGLIALEQWIEKFHSRCEVEASNIHNLQLKSEIVNLAKGNSLWCWNFHREREHPANVNTH